MILNGQVFPAYGLMSGMVSPNQHHYLPTRSRQGSETKSIPEDDSQGAQAIYTAGKTRATKDIDGPINALGPKSISTP